MPDEATVAHAKIAVPRLVGGELRSVTPLRGDASARRYFRLHIGGSETKSLIVMALPTSNQSEEANHGDPPRELPFVDVCRFFERGNLPVPKIHLYDPLARLVYLEDLGDVTLEQHIAKVPESKLTCYKQAIDLLADLQTFGESHTHGTVAYQRRFDLKLLRWELDHFKEWLLWADRKVNLDTRDDANLEREFDRLATLLADAPQTLVHRDFQSRNLMVQGDRLRLIDFQDALIGPLPYDLVGLLRDSYVVLSPQEVDALIDHYLTLRPFSEGQSAFRRWFDLQAVQRKLKDAGRFIYIDRVKGNPSFLPYVQDSLFYVRQALERLDDFSALRLLLTKMLPEFG